MKDKIDFIADLLKSNKINASQKERLFALATDEIRNIGKSDEIIFAEIAELKKRINDIGKITTVVKPSSTVKNMVKSHSPKTMVKFLYSFSLDDKFKWFTHDPEGLLTAFNYKEYIENAKGEYDKTTGWNINNGTYHNVKNFIIDTGESNKTNIFNKGKINCSWRDLEKWCIEHPNTHPYRAEINNEFFKKHINQFKHIIEFRTDDTDSTFNFRIKKVIRDILGVDFVPKFTQSFDDIGQAVKIYCDINLLLNSIEQIINWIRLNKSKSNEVDINLIDFDDFYQLEINHKNSYFSVAPNNEKLKGISGDFDKTRKMLFSIADWEIIATINHNDVIADYKITCLDSNSELMNNILTPNKIEKLNDNSNCVKHILKLYKTQNL
jgi:hypothetical protein